MSALLPTQSLCTGLPIAAQHTILCVVFVACSFLPRYCDCLGEVTMRDVIDNVRANELLYQHCDAEVRVTHRIYRKPVQFVADNIHEVISSDKIVKYVLQDGMFRTDLQESTLDTSSKNQNARTRLSLFDGESSRIRDGRIVNIRAGRTVDSHILRPHMLILQCSTYPVPLSALLTGRDAVAAYGDKLIGDRTELVVEYGGREAIDGHDCHKVVWRRRNSTSHRITSTIHLWLAADRNWLPIRVRVLSHKYSTTLPHSEADVSDFRELEPNVWCPTHARTMTFIGDSLRKYGRQERSFGRTFYVSRFTLSPAYPKEFFQSLDIPNGVSVYRLDSEGHVTKSYRHGVGSESVGTPLWRRWWFVGNVAVLAALLLCIVYFRRRSNMAHQA